MANARIEPSTYSAIGTSKTPRELVSTTSEFSSSGKATRSTPALAVCTQHSLSAAGQAGRTASEVKSQTSRTSDPGSADGSWVAVA